MSQLKETSKLTKTELYAILTGIFCTCLIISNILAAKTFILWEDILLPCAVIIFPVTYIINDVLAEIYGYNKAKRVIYLGFILNLLAVLLYHISIYLQGPVFNNAQNEAFSMVLGSTFRILLASFTAYLIGSLINSYLMVWLKEKAEKHLFFRCIFSTLCGEGVDATIFITIAFFGTIPMILLISMIIAQALFKTIYEILIYPATRTVIGYIKKLPS